MLYRSPKKVSQKGLPALRKDLSIFMATNKSVYARFSKRSVFFDELPDAITKRKDATRRLRVFAVAVDVLRKSEDFSMRKNKVGQKEFEVRGQAFSGEMICVHVRETVDHKKKDKKLQFISCFCSK